MTAHSDGALRLALGLAGSALVAGLSHRRGSLSRSGAALAVPVGAAIAWGGGGAWFAVLGCFFVTSTLLGRVGRARKEAVKREFEKGDTRDGWQVVANGGVAALVAACFGAGGLGVAPGVVWAGAFLGALATANGDTWATELGTLSRTPPRTLLGLRRVPPGTSGAISGVGLAATVAGALAVGLVAALGERVSPGAFGLAPGRLLGLAAVTGFLGALSDSLLGATAQAAYRCPRCARDVEAARHACGAATVQVRGWRLIDNDVVNLTATAIGACLGAGLVALILGE